MTYKYSYYTNYICRLVLLTGLLLHAGIYAVANHKDTAAITTLEGMQTSKESQGWLHSITFEGLEFRSSFLYKDSVSCLLLDSLAMDYFDGLQRATHLDSTQWMDSVYAARLHALGTTIPLDYNTHVRNFIELYLYKKQDLSKRVLGLSTYYYPLFEEVFRAHGVPPEIKHLAVVESALNPHAVSRMRAVGLWQFMYHTGYMYDLKTGYYIDDRRDPYRATEAAARYLSDLHKQFNQNWLLAIAAYNCGPGNVRRAIRRSGGKYDYWDIWRYLPRETRGYVPALIAVNYLMNYAGAHGLEPVMPDSTLVVMNNTETETIMAEERLSLELLAEQLGLPESTLRFLNPALKQHLLPNLATPYPVNLPCEAIIPFRQLSDSLYAWERARMGDHYAKEERIDYYVKYGDNLSTIASRHGIRVRDIMEWNGLRSTRIHPRQKLMLYVKAYDDRGSNSKSKNTAAGTKEKSSTPVMRANGNNDNDTYMTADRKTIYHRVGSGDTLWDIARTYPGISVDDLRSMNEIHNVRYLKPGMVLTIKLSD